jgi:putative flavoprotein involved in K+ transport
VLVIGGGQAGIAAGHYLSGTGLRFLIVEGNQRIGDSWRQRWDSLRLFTPAEFNGLPGMPFRAASRFHYPSKDEMADYLERYAAAMSLPVVTGTRIDLLQQSDCRFIARAAGRTFAADQVIVAMSSFQRQRPPAFASELSSSIYSVHAGEYRNPAQLAPGSVLVVGAGNSGAEIALELAAAGRRTWLAGEPPGVVPFDQGGFFARHVLNRIVLRGVFHRLLTIRTPMGRKHRATALNGAAPLIRTKPKHLAAAGVARVSRICGVEDGLPLLEDGSTISVDNVVWCTGFQPDFKWIDMPVFDAGGMPQHEAGVVPRCSGLYFVGLHYLYALSSGMVHGVARDAKRIVDAATAKARTLAINSTLSFE